MNPYEAPRSDEPAAEPRSPEAKGRLALVIGVAAGGVLVRWVLESMRLPFVERWSLLLTGAAIGGAAAGAVPSDPKRQWVLITIVVTALALVVGYLLPLPGGAIRVLYPWWAVAAIMMATGNVQRVVRSIDKVESSLARDEDQRALFARRDIRPLAPTKAPARFACAGCGELFVEADLETIDGKRRCSSCG